MRMGNEVQAEQDQPHPDVPTPPAASAGPVTKAETFAATLTRLVDIEHTEARLYREKLTLRSVPHSTADYEGTPRQSQQGPVRRLRRRLDHRPDLRAAPDPVCPRAGCRPR